MRWSWTVRPKGAARVPALVISWIGRRQEQAIWASMKRYLEPRNHGHDNSVETWLMRWDQWKKV